MSLETLLLDSRWDDSIPPRALLLYMVLRADVASNHTEVARSEKNRDRLVSGVTMERVAEQFGWTDVAVDETFAELVAAGLIRGNDGRWHLGVIRDHAPVWRRFEPVSWEVSVKSLDEVIADTSELTARLRKRDKLREEVERQDRKKKPTQDRLASEVFDDSQTQRLHREVVAWFEEEYFTAFDEACPLPEGEGKQPYVLPYVWAKNAVKWCSHDRDLLRRMVLFLFEHWDAVRGAFADRGIDVTNRPSMKLLGTFVFMDIIRGWCLAGGVSEVPKRKKKPGGDEITHRYRDDGEEYEDLQL